MTPRTRTGSWLLAALFVFLASCGSADTDATTASAAQPESTSAPTAATPEESGASSYSALPGTGVVSADFDAVLDECGQNILIDGDVWAGLDSDLTTEIGQPLRDAMHLMTGSNPTSCRPLEIVAPAVDPQDLGATWATSLGHVDPELRIDIFVYEPGQAGDVELREARAALTDALPTGTKIHGAYTADNFAIIYSWLNSEGLEDTPRDVVLIGGHYSVKSFR